MADIKVTIEDAQPINVSLGEAVNVYEGTGDYNDLNNLPDLTLKADKTYVDTQDTALQDAIDTKQPTGDYATNTALTSGLDTKVDKAPGKQLSDNNYTQDEKNKLAGIEAGAEVNEVSPADLALKADETALSAHTSNTSNPHSVTKAQVGLSDVPNLDTTAAVANQHTHANKAVLDATTASFTTADEMKLDGIAAGAQVNTVTSVAGKTGVVTLAKGDVGLGNVDNTSDMNKPVSTAQATAIDTKVDKAGDTMTGILNLATNLTAAQLMPPQVNINNTGGNARLMVGHSGGNYASEVQYGRNGAAVWHMGLQADGTFSFVQSGVALRMILDTSGRMLPGGNATQELGSASRYWSNLYATRATIGGTSYTTGTGFPNGVVSAPVGSIYIDTNVTGGTISWSKASGTGSTGWVKAIAATGNVAGVGTDKITVSDTEPSSPALGDLWVVI